MSTPAFPTLPIGPLEHLAMDYARLRGEGIRLLERYAGARWTDFNTHDPGITILEQLCYAITDLGYRIAYPVADLIAGGDGEAALPGPATILTTDPVTHADLRKLVLDVEGIGNAWIEAPNEPEIEFYHHRGSEELRLQPDPSAVDARAVRLSGLHQVLLQTSDRLPSDVALARVNARVHGRRGLGEDFTLALLGTHEVWVQARIEVGPVEDPVDVLADIVERIEAYLAPTVRFTSLPDARAEGRRIDELFEGPALERGFVLGELPQARRAVRTSDLLHVIMDVPAVRAVRSIALANSSESPRERWSLRITPGQVAALATNSELTLLRGGLPIRVDAGRVRARLEERRAAARDAMRSSTGTPDVRPAPGRDRKLSSHTSIQHQLPAVYGVGALGLPATAPALRRAQARQLEAYLLFFDQLLANAFAQLAHAHELLSPVAESTRTYFAQPIEDPRLRIGALLRQEPAAHRAWLDTTVEGVSAGSDPYARRKRFLTHLLARFAEEIGDYSQIGGTSEAPGAGLALIEDRQTFLRQYPRLSRGRGSGYDIYSEESGPSALEQRLRLKLGLREHPRFHLVEHILLRPIVEDTRQLGADGDPQVPLLAGVAEPDPWSLQISFVFETREGGKPNDWFEQMVTDAVLAETPAHLRPHLHWFGAEDGEDHFTAFEAAWVAFRAAYRAYRQAKLQATLVPDEIHLRVRDARDRVIDLLGFARTYPLRDLPLPRLLMVAPNEPAAISIGFSQQGVLYTLCDRTTGDPILVEGEPVAAPGDGGTIELLTPPIVEDISFRILAVKIEGSDSDELRREAWLHGTVRVEEGVDVSLVARIRTLPLLDSTDDNPQPADARIGDYAVEAEIEVLESQEGIVYELLDDADHARVLSASQVIGTSGTIVLKTVPMLEDVELRVRATRPGGDGEDEELRTGLLTLVLPLRVRANRGPTVSLLGGAVVPHGGAKTMRLSPIQTSVEYRVWRRRIRDCEFLHAEPPPAPAFGEIADGQTVWMVRPGPAQWGELQPLGLAKADTGDTLDIPLGSFVEDAYLFVQAIKHHRRGPGISETIDSIVELAGVRAVLVRPDPQRMLRIRTAIAGDTAVGPLLVQDGQPGVFYDLRAGDTSIGLPVYFHQRDDITSSLNKGLAQKTEGLSPADAVAALARGLVIEVDLAIARTRDDAPEDLDTKVPLPPLVEVEPLPLGTVLQVIARRASSGVKVELARTAKLDAVPAIHADPATVAPGAASQIVIEASVSGEHYRLLRGEELVAEATGTGETIALDTGPLDAPVVLQVAIERSEPGTLPVERRVAVSVDVQ